MADIKFMDISENNNPASTDSVLIANSTSGVKRTTLENIVNMAPKPESTKGLIMTAVLHIASNGLKDCSITAPSFEGYTFASWLTANAPVIIHTVESPTTVLSFNEAGANDAYIMVMYVKSDSLIAKSSEGAIEVTVTPGTVTPDK